MSENKKKCHSCQQTFGFLRKNLECSQCRIDICAECVKNPDFSTSTIRMCKSCYDVVSFVLSDITVVKSQYVGGHSIVHVIDKIKSKKGVISTEQAIVHLKYIAYKAGANAITHLQMHKDKTSTGNYIHSIYKAEGTAVIIEKNIGETAVKKVNHSSLKNKSNDQGLVEGLNRLVELYQQELLTECEFKAAKEKLINS